MAVASLLPATLLNGWLRIGTIVALLGLNFGIFVTLMSVFLCFIRRLLSWYCPRSFGNRGIQVIGGKIFDVVRSQECSFFLILCKGGELYGIVFLSLVHWVMPLKE